MDVKKFIKPFKGSFMGVEYESAESLFSQFVTETISQRIESRAIRVWGKVGEVAPPTSSFP